MHNNSVVHLKETLLDSEVRLTKPQSEGSDLVPTPSVISESKDTTSSPKMHEEETKFSLRELDASYLDAVERGDMETAQRMVLEAALSVGKGGHDVDFNIISSVYDKREDSVARWVNDGKMLWVDKEKALNYLHHSAPIAEALSNPRLMSTTKVIQNFENLNIEPQFSLRELDAPYLDAVERGDMETAQRMVLEAALSVGKGGHDVDFNIISSVYDKREDSVARWVNATNGVEITKITTAFGRDITKIEASSKEKEIYRNENAAEQISGSDNSHLYARLLSTTKVIQNFENLNIEPQFSLREPIFYSNAEYAVRGIKQEKAMLEQWLKMIEKNGGLTTANPF